VVSAPNLYTGWVVLVSLVYFGVADFLYISRFAAYMMIDTQVLSTESLSIESLSIDGGDVPSLPPAPTTVGTASGKSRNGAF
jgi:hypothetical protein